MKICALIEENKRKNTGFVTEHGLCLYFEKNGKRILFDTGASDSFIYNATLIGIDLLKVDICIITHAYNDHTGGLKYFLDINSHAKIYIKKEATGDFYIKRKSRMENIGIDPKLFEKYPDRFVFIDKDTEISEGIFAVNIDKHRHYPHFTKLMFSMINGTLKKDDLTHEMFAAVKEPDGIVVLTGCSHHGVLNILMTAEQKFGKIESVIGGFHLDGKKRFGVFRKKESGTEISAIIKYINNNHIKKVYVGHCTSEEQFEKLAMYARVKKLYAGDIVDI